MNSACQAKVAKPDSGDESDEQEYDPYLHRVRVISCGQAIRQAHAAQAEGADGAEDGKVRGPDDSSSDDEDYQGGESSRCGAAMQLALEGSRLCSSAAEEYDSDPSSSDGGDEGEGESGDKPKHKKHKEAKDKGEPASSSGSDDEAPKAAPKPKACAARIATVVQPHRPSQRTPIRPRRPRPRQTRRTRSGSGRRTARPPVQARARRTPKRRAMPAAQQSCSAVSQTKRKQRKKDPNAPKAPVSAYMIWLAGSREKIKAGLVPYS